MKLVKETAEYSIYQRNDKRYAVKDSKKNWVNGEDKVAILLKEKLVKAPEPKPAEPEVEEPAAEAAEETSPDATEEEKAD